MAEDQLSRFARMLRVYRWVLLAACPLMTLVGLLNLDGGWIPIVSFAGAGGVLLVAADVYYLELRTARRIAERV